MPAFQPEVISTDAQNGIELEPVQNTNGLAVYSGQVFEPDPSSSNGIIYVNNVPALQPTFTLSLQRPSKTSRISKGRVKLVLPKPVVEAGVTQPVKSYENSFDITFMSSEKATEAERIQMLDLAIAALSSPVVRTVIGGNKSVW